MGPFLSRYMREGQAGSGPESLLRQVLEQFLHAGEEAFGFGAGGALAVASLGKLPQQLLLALREVDRRLDRDLDVHVAPRGRAQHAHALALEAELPAGLRARGDRELG